MYVITFDPIPDVVSSEDTTAAAIYAYLTLPDAHRNATSTLLGCALRYLRPVIISCLAPGSTLSQSCVGAAW